MTAENNDPLGRDVPEDAPQAPENLPDKPSQAEGDVGDDDAS